MLYLKCVIFLFFAYFINAAALAEDLKLADGRILKNFKIINHSPKDAMVIHDGGAETVLLQNLPKGLRNKYDYSETKAEAYEEEQAEAEKAFIKEQKEKKLIFKYQLLEKRRLDKLRKEAIRESFYVFNVADDGLLVVDQVFREESYIFNDKLRTRSVPEKGEEVSLVTNYPSDGVVDGQLIKGYFTRIGTYSYTTVDGARKTVKKLIFFPE